MRHNPTLNQKGKVTYNPSIVSGIVALAIEEVDGVYLLNAKNKGIKLSFEKSGISADISVKLDSTANVSSVAFKIQQSIKHNVESMTKYKVASVDVHVRDVNFTDDGIG